MSPPRPLAPGRSPLLFLGPTIFGRTEFDLAGFMGPVPILFTIDPPTPPSKVTAPGGGLPPPSEEDRQSVQILRLQSFMV